MDSARLAGVEPVFVSDSVDVIHAVGHGVITCNIELETGTDRVAFYVEHNIGWDKAPEWIINVQGDMPFGTAPFIRALIDATKAADFDVDIITPRARIDFVDTFDNSVDFCRSSLLSHVGMYAYRKVALRSFYEFRGSDRVRSVEKACNLEQCRAVAMKMKIQFVDLEVLPPLEVNTQADLDRINEIVERTHAGSAGFSADERVQLALAGGG